MAKPQLSPLTAIRERLSRFNARRRSGADGPSPARQAASRGRPGPTSARLESLDEAAWRARYLAALRRLGGDATPKALRARTRAWRGWSAATRALQALVVDGAVRQANPGEAGPLSRLWRKAHYCLTLGTDRSGGQEYFESHPALIAPVSGQEKIPKISHSKGIV